MKCEKCNNNEAVFHYQSNINGEKNEYHLCADCAKAEGFGNILEFRPNSMFENFWREPFGGMLGSFFSDPFGSLTDGFFTEPFRTLEDGFFGRSLFAPTIAKPNVNVSIGESEEKTETAEKGAENIPEDAGRDICRKREIHALKHQLRTAVQAEEFEKAADLRDKIRELEK